MTRWHTTGLALLLLAWAAVAGSTRLVPAPTTVATTLWTMRGAFAVDLGRSLLRVASGYAAAVGVAGVVAPAMAAWGWLDTQLDALLGAVRAVPPLAWAPLLLLWLGIGDGTSALIVFLGAFFPIVRAFRAGLGAAPADLCFAAENLGAGRAAVLWRVRLPAAVPAGFTGLRLGWTLAWMSLVAAELSGADQGLGQRILDARNLARPDIAVAGMVVLGSVAAASELLLGLVERRLLRWRPR